MDRSLKADLRCCHLGRSLGASEKSDGSTHHRRSQITEEAVLQEGRLASDRDPLKDFDICAFHTEEGPCTGSGFILLSPDDWYSNVRSRALAALHQLRTRCMHLRTRSTKDLLNRRPYLGNARLNLLLDLLRYPSFTDPDHKSQLARPPWTPKPDHLPDLATDTELIAAITCRPFLQDKFVRCSASLSSWKGPCLNKLGEFCFTRASSLSYTGTELLNL